MKCADPTCRADAALLKIYRRGYELRGKLLVAHRIGVQPSDATLDGLSDVAEKLRALDAAEATEGK